MSQPTMKAVRLHGAYDLRLHDEAVPVPSLGEALLRVKAVGLCGSDLHWYTEGGIGAARLGRPVVPSHEFAGVIESGPRRGQRVAVEPNVHCGVCDLCLEGKPHICRAPRFAGHTITDGALREYAAWPEHLLHSLPDSLSDVDGAMLEPLGVALHSVGLGTVAPGMMVGVFGCGPIGLMILQVARAAGATHLFATDTLAHRLAAAQACGATAVLQVRDPGQDQDGSPELGTMVWEATGGRGVDVAFEAAGAPKALEDAIVATKPGGRVVLAGITADNRTSFTASSARDKELSIHTVRRMSNTYPRAIRLAESGRVNVRLVVSHTFPLEQYTQAFGVAKRREGLKVILEP